MELRRQTGILRSRRQSRRIKKFLPSLSRVKNYHQMAVTCRASSEHPEMPQVVLLLVTAHLGQEHKQPTIHDPLRSPSHEQDPLKRNAPMSRVLRAASLMLSERSNILTSTKKLTTSKVGPPRPRFTPHPGKATPCPVLHLPAIWNHLHIEDCSGATWTLYIPEYPLDLHNTSPEYFRHQQHSVHGSGQQWAPYCARRWLQQQPLMCTLSQYHAAPRLTPLTLSTRHLQGERKERETSHFMWQVNVKNTGHAGGIVLFSFHGGRGVDAVWGGRQWSLDHDAVNYLTYSRRSARQPRHTRARWHWRQLLYTKFICSTPTLW